MEVMVATAVVMVIVLGGMGYLCTSARLAREADRMSTAMHLALLLLESWRETPHVYTAGAPYWPAGFDPLGTYDGAAMDVVTGESLHDPQWNCPVTILPGTEGPPLSADAGGLAWTRLGWYKARISTATYYILLAYAPASHSAANPAQVSVCALQVTIGWSRHGDVGYHPDCAHIRITSYD